MITLHNTLTGTKEEFHPINLPCVTMYNCGPTVYDYAHIGNLRAYVFADMLRRTLELHNYTVEQVINITDVGHLTEDDHDSGEDKIEARASKQNKTAQEIASFYTDAFFDDLADLNIKTDGTKFPRASEHIDEQIKLIQALENNGVTYKTSDGIYFDTKKFDGYGKLGKIDREKLEEGARIGINTERRNPTDFALWKFSPEDTKRQQEWDSPWGVGFPGWHIECSAMSMKYLGETFDIHTGGIDHIPIHHNNEIAQAECATGKPLANYWLHNAFLDMKGEKMAKSEGNFITLRDLKEEGISPITYRLWLLTAHYRSPASFDPDVLHGLERSLTNLADQLHTFDDSGVIPDTYKDSVKERLSDDLDTPAVISLIWTTVRDSDIEPATRRAVVEYALDVLGVDISAFESKRVKIEDLPAEIAALLRDRESARARDDYVRADELRDEILKKGYELKDTPDGPVVNALN